MDIITDLIRATSSPTVRHGSTTLDLPSLQAWLRTRIGVHWQPPTMIEIDPLERAEPARGQDLIREVIESHTQDYVPGYAWQDKVVRTMEEIVPYTARGLLDKLLEPNPILESPWPGFFGDENLEPDDRRLGW